ncbi:MAG: diguanylate cyclase [Bdellovibrionales bacterium]|nr:diguanylate cyclase [Bdellovibrionales bacterium]
MADQAKILLVDDDHDNLKIVGRLLEKAGYEILAVDSGAKGLEAIDDFRPDLILLDVNMPGMDGMQTIQRLNEKKVTAAVVFVTANTDTDDVIRGLDAGALDYISKPFSGMELLARVRAQLRVIKLQNELREANKKLQSMVDIDDLTGLYNMRSIYEKVDNEIERSRRYGHGVAVVMLDMDNFKRVNDNHDHLFGSFVLSEVGKIIKDTMRSVDFAARYGGDEFLICLTHTGMEGALIFCERLRKALEKHDFVSGPDSIKLTGSMGCAVILGGEPPIDARSLVRYADKGLYTSKETGRNKVTPVDLLKDTPTDNGKHEQVS